MMNVVRFHPRQHTRRWITASLATLLAAICAQAAKPAGTEGKESFMYVGTYTKAGSNSKGIYAYRFNSRGGEITSLGLAAENANPSFLAVHPNHRFLYAVNEVSSEKGEKSGAVSSFSIDRATGKLTLLNAVASKGADPCYITVDQTGKYVLIANYTGGSIAVFPVGEDGRLGEASSFIQHTGHGPNPKRQDAPHAHSIDLSPDNRFAIVDDLGLDETLAYKFDGGKGSLANPNIAKAAPGAGPRHFAFHPNGKFGYVIDELSSTVSVFSYDARTGGLNPLQTISTLPKEFTGENTDAEIAVHPSGKFLYASNRGHDSIAVFAIDPRRGTLTLVENAPDPGKTPRNFEIDPSGKMLFVANQNSNNVVVFRIDQKTGHLTPTGKVLQVGQPVCVKFVPVD